VSDTGIRILELSPKGKGFFPTAFSEVPLASNIIVNHMIMNQDKLAENIKKAIAKAKGLDTKYVIACVPESKSFLRVLEVAKMSEEEITTSLPFELEQNIPVPIDLVYLDWEPLSEVG